MTLSSLTFNLGSCFASAGTDFVTVLSEGGQALRLSPGLHRPQENENQVLLSELLGCDFAGRLIGCNLITL